MTTAVRLLTKAVISEPQRDAGWLAERCVYCGRRCYGRACSAHRDLPQIENQLFTQSNETAASLDPGSATVSQPKGV